MGLEHDCAATRLGSIAGNTLIVESGKYLIGSAYIYITITVSASSPASPIPTPFVYYSLSLSYIIVPAG